MVLKLLSLVIVALGIIIAVAGIIAPTESPSMIGGLLIFVGIVLYTLLPGQINI